MTETLDGPLHEVGELGEAVPPPPWILGFRGVPAAAPENTQASLEGAIDLGLDGVRYEVRACASGELFLLADATLERTTDAHGLLAARTLPELAGLDAGSWFHRRFRGERLALLEEALELCGRSPGSSPMHVIELAAPVAPGALGELARVLEGADRRLSLRIATHSRRTAQELVDLGLAAMLVVPRATEEVRRFARDARLAAVGVESGPWRGEVDSQPWSVERWALCLDDPEDLLRAAREPLFGIATREPLRALAARALARFAPQHGAGDARGAWPVAADELVIDPRPDSGSASGGEWTGAWEVGARVENPFGWSVRARVGLVVRRGAFQVEGLPLDLELAPGESRAFAFAVRGGSWSPGGDPLLVARLAWRRGPGRAEERLSFDAPLARVRVARLAGGAQRLVLLKERPGERGASVTLATRRGALQVAIEDAGGLADPELLVHLDGVVHRGGPRLVLELPSPRPESVSFSAGIVGRAGGELRVRRWAGGLPDAFEGGAPGRLLLGRES